MSRNNYWTNDDGLVVGFGARDSETELAARTRTAGEVQELVMDIVGVNLTDATTPANLPSSAFIPANSLIVEADLIVDEAFAGATAVLDIGTYEVDGTIIDDDGIDAAIAVGALTADTLIACDGGQVGTVITQDAYLGATNDTADFTAGTAKLVVKFIKQ